MRERDRTVGFLMAGLLMVLVGLYSTAAWAATLQSLHFRAAAPPSTGSVGVLLKAIGFPTIETDVALDSTVETSGQLVARKAANTLCSKIYEACAADGPGGVMCTPAVSPCPVAFGSGLSIDVTGGRDGATFNLQHGAGAEDVRVTTGAGNVANLNCDGRNYYRDIGSDIASRVLLQVRPNGILGTVQVMIHHTQGGQTPKTASFNITAGNVGDSQAIHNGIRDAINALSFSPDVIAVTHPASGASLPLTYSPGSFYQTHFVEITNAQAASVTEVQVIVVQGHGLTIEGTENLSDVPALGSWGIIVVVAMLLLSGYWLMRRRRGTATA